MGLRKKLQRHLARIGKCRKKTPIRMHLLGISLVGTYDTGFLLEIHTESINADAMF